MYLVIITVEFMFLRLFFNRENLFLIEAQKRRNTLCNSSFCNEEMTKDWPSGAEGA